MLKLYNNILNYAQKIIKLCYKQPCMHKLCVFTCQNQLTRFPRKEFIAVYWQTYVWSSSQWIIVFVVTAQGEEGGIKIGVGMGVKRGVRMSVKMGVNKDVLGVIKVVRMDVKSSVTYQFAVVFVVLVIFMIFIYTITKSIYQSLDILDICK